MSPDGNSILYRKVIKGPALSGQIWIMNPDCTGLKQVSHGPWSHAQPARAFDGKAIYAYQFKEDPDYEFGSVVRISIKP